MKTSFYAMQLQAPSTPLVRIDRDTPGVHSNQVMIEVEACGVCRTDLHLIDNELPGIRYPIVPGHEVVGRVCALGGAAELELSIGQRIGIPWLGYTCGKCDYCEHGRENLCDTAQFTGYTRDGGFATHCVVDADFAFPLEDTSNPVHLAPLMCAGLIGYRTWSFAAEAEVLGLYGFGAAAHIVCQIALHHGQEVLAFVRPGDDMAMQFARDMGASWAGSSDQKPPKELDAALIFAPVGNLVPRALQCVRKGGHVVCGGIHMSDIPSFPYADLWHERRISSVANLTRKDGLDFFPLARAAGVTCETTQYPLEDANHAVDDLRHGRLSGAAVLIP
ncbi:MAG: zinc-dependent alcohol dehydrogenase family protein [Pseudomonadota bacterium]